MLTSFHFKLSLSPTYMPRGCVGVWISYVCDLDMGHGIYSAFEIRLADYPGQRATIFSCLFPSNQFTQSPTIHVFQLTPAANVHYPVDQISRPVYPAAVEYLSFTLRLPDADGRICAGASHCRVIWKKKFVFATRVLETTFRRTG